MSRSPAVILYDSAGLPLAVQDGVAVPANTKGTLLHGIDGSGNARRMKVDTAGRPEITGIGTNGAIIIEGVSGGQAIKTTSQEPSDASKRIFSALLNSGNENMYVDGSSTPVEFVFGADPTDDIYITSIRFIINAADIQFKPGSGSGTFQKINAITNGVKLEVRSVDVTTELALFKRDEHFLAFGGNDVLDQTDTSDLLTAEYTVVGLHLVANSGDFVKVTIQDNIVNSGHIYFACYVKGYKP